MALQKTSIPINFVKGLDTKSDPYQLSMDNFLVMQNSVFTTSGRISKRNGFASKTSLPNAQQTTLTTLNDNLIATGSNLYALSQDTNQWINEGTVQPVSLNTQPLVRVSTSQTSPDTSVAASGLICLVYVDNSISYYQISDSSTGQQIVPRTSLGSTAHSPRTFLLGQYFIITFIATVTGTPHLRYIAIPTSNPTNPGTASDISSDVKSLTTGYDGFIANNSLYLAWSASANNIKATYMSSTLSIAAAITIVGHTATYMSVTADLAQSTPVIWITFWDSGNGYSAAYNQILVQILAPTQIITTVTINELTTIAASQTLHIYYENANNYNSTGAYPNATKTDYISRTTLTQAGAQGGIFVVLRSVGLASKPIIQFVYTLPTAPTVQVRGPILPPGATLISFNIYMLATYGESNTDLASAGPDQNTYFLIDDSGNIYMRLAYSNGGGYAASQVLPTISLLNDIYYVPYLVNDFLAPLNKTTNSGIPINSIYTQTGVNLAKFGINTDGQHSSEIAGALHLTGGQLWEYDGVRPVEHGFQVWPDNVVSTTTTGAGAIAAGTYFYVFTYEWTDNQGNLHRSAPSVPVKQVTTTASSTNTIYVPTLRLTYKIAPNPVRIVGYRWSVAQQVYYQFTSLTSPTLNDTTVDYVTITDTSSDAQILGNVILYTTGSVLENIAAPACIDSALFNNRLWLIDAEDQNLLWYSKQVIETVPVEMSDLLTIYVAPTTGAQGSTGPMTALSAMDDKLIIFKRDAIYYINGIGPDNTGANSTYSDPVFITASVGCANPNSIVLTPGGLMFQSDKGIWLLGRGLDTNYIGAPVEIYNAQTVKSSQTIPGTTQVRFILDNSITLMYDYYFKQWGTFTNISAVSSTLWQGFQTYLNSFGQVFQEAPGTYIDGSTPVLLSLTSAWMNLAGLQGFERFYFANLLGTYFTPFKLNVGFAYNYNSSLNQTVLVTPDNFGGNYGVLPNTYGGGNGYGNSEGNVFTARIFPNKQKCQSFQVSIQEVYDSSLSVPAGQGLTLSGMNLIAGVKRGFRTQSANKSFG